MKQTAMTETDVISLVITNEILAEHRSKDTCLDRLLKNLSVDPDSWKNYIEIRISSPEKAPHYEQIYRKHLKVVQRKSPDGDSKRKTEAELTSIINYCSSYPDADIRFIILRCPKNHYIVFCGQVGDQRDVISVGITELRQTPPDWVLQRLSELDQARGKEIAEGRM